MSKYIITNHHGKLGLSLIERSDLGPLGIQYNHLIPHGVVEDKVLLSKMANAESMYDLLRKLDKMSEDGRIRNLLREIEKAPTVEIYPR